MIRKMVKGLFTVCSRTLSVRPTSSLYRALYEEARAEWERLADIVAALGPEALMVVSPERIIQSCNDSVRNLFGYESHELIGCTTDLLYFDRRSSPSHGKEIYEILERVGSHTGPATGKRKNETLIPLEIHTAKLRNRPGAVLLLRDVSERRRLEDELKRGTQRLQAALEVRTDQLKRAMVRLREALNDRRRAIERAQRVYDEMERRVQERTAALEQAFHELKELDRTKDELLSSVSHELRTPLTSILSFSEILLNYPKEDAGTQRDFLSIIHSESRRLTRLVNDLLDLSKIQAGKMEWHFEAGDLSAVIEKALRSMGSLVVSKGLRIECDIEDALPPAVIDEDRMVQVLINLLSNAVKFSPEGRSIRIVAARAPGTHPESGRGQSVDISVSDSGIGIRSEDLHRIFEPFTQCRHALGARPGGTGLGLSICREIVNAHGGTLWVESVYGKGSTFHVTLPVEIPAMASSAAGGYGAALFA